MIAAEEDISTGTNEKSNDNEEIIASTKIHNDFDADEDGCSSKLDDKSAESDMDSDSAVSVLNHLNGKSDRQSDDAPSRSSSIQSDKSAIIRLNSELLKAKQSNWEVVDALTAAYDDIRDLRKREQRLNNILTGNLENVGSSKGDALGSPKATEIKILQTQLEIRGEELSKAKNNIRRLMGERDRLKEECSKTRASLRFLTLQDTRKETEIAMVESNLKSLKEEMREKDQAGLVLKENVLNLEHQLRKAKNSAQKTEAEKEILKDNLKQREDKIIELKSKLKELENEYDIVQSDLSVRTSELTRIKSNESNDIFKEIENELAKELNTMELKLVEMKEKSRQDDQTMNEMREKLKEWEKYGSRMSNTMEEYINEVNSQHLEARKEIAKYIDNLEKELAQVKARQQPLEREVQRDDQIFQRNTLSRSPRKRSTGKKLPALRSPPQEIVPTTSRKKSDSSLSGALDSDGSTDDIGYYPSDVNESDISRPSSSHKGPRRTLPMTPSDIEVLCGDSPEEYFAKQSRRKRQPDRSDRHRARVFPRIRNNQDSGLGESLQCREDGRGVRPQTTYPWIKKSPDKTIRPSSAFSCGGEAADDESESFPTITPISLDTGSPNSTAAESDQVHKAMKVDITTSSPMKKRNHIPLRRFLSHDRVRAHRRHAALLLVFRYLTPLELCGLAQVCREWRSLSEHPSLWKHVSLVDTAVNNMTLLSISRRCKPLQHLFLKGLKKFNPRKGVRCKADENSCYLEKGLEYILKVSAEKMSSIHIEDCGNLLTDRCLLLTGSHCRNLQSFTYISDKYPACPEALWALWNCRSLTSLRVPPLIPNEHPKRFNDKSCETIANCWPALTKLSIGGPGITTTGLLHIAKGCLRLQELELDRTHHVTEETAYALCLTGLRGLQVLLFTFTTASPGAIKQFYAACPRLEFIAVHVGISDYFSDVTDQENIRKYKRIISKLEALRDENSDLARVLRIKADYG